MSARPEMNQKAGLEWLYGTQLFGIKMGLENVRRLLDALELPMRGQRFIHVAGTNGKGSTCAFAHAILKEAGISAGLFTSPHLIRFNERIRDTTRSIADEEIAAGLGRLRSLVQDWEPHPTFFELTLALALDWFRERQVEWVVLETGLGGRLDATNVVTPEVGVITSIGWDHAEVLGESLALIAGEKAGIIKKRVPVVTQEQAPEVMAVLQGVAAEAEAPLRVVQPWRQSPLGLSGQHQQWNAALAVEALQAAEVDVDQETVERGLLGVQWPARFQIIGRRIIDGAHNLEAMQRLVQTWQEVFPGQRAVAVFGAVAGKDVAGMMGILAPLVAEWRFTAFASPRAMATNELMALWEGAGGPKVPVLQYQSVDEALAAPADAPLLIAGSLYLAGEALALCQGDTGAFEASSQ